jgi:peptide/nickel transport system substrate-binding protein
MPWFVRSIPVRLVIAISLIVVGLLATGHPLRITERPQLVIGLSKPIESTLSALSLWHSTALLSAAVHRALYEQDAAGMLVPALADGLPSRAIDRTSTGDAAQLIVRISLRSDLSWSDGAPLTAADVRFTYDLLKRAPDADETIVEAIEAIATPTDRELVLSYKPGRDLSAARFLLQPIYARHALREVRPEALLSSPYSLVPVGAGPYRVREWRFVGMPRPGAGIVAVPASSLEPAVQSITLEANPYYAGSRPAVDLRLVVIPTETDLANALRRGAIDLIAEDSFEPGSPLAAQLAADGFQLERSPGARVDRLDFNVRSPQLASATVRRAVALAIDRSALADLAGADGHIMTSWLPRVSRAHLDVLVRPQADLARSRRLLEDAGLAPKSAPASREDRPGLRLKMYVATDSTVGVQAAPRIAAMLRDVWIEVDVRYVPLQMLLSSGGILIRGDYDLAIFPWRVEADPDALRMWHTRMIPTESNGWRGNNFTRWSNAVNDLSLERAAASVSLGDQTAALQEQQRIFADDLPSLPLFEFDNVAVHNGRVSGFVLPAGTLPSTSRAAAWAATGR